MDRKVKIICTGINKYDSYRTLSFCENDAEELADVFNEKIPDCESIKITSKNRTTNKFNVLSILEETSSEDYSEDDMVLFYFAGHGINLDGEDYLALSDSNHEAGLDTLLSTECIIDLLKQSGSGTNILIIDACRSHVDRGVSNRFGSRTAALANKKGVVAFFSCDIGEISQEIIFPENSGHGVFTYSLIESLRSSEDGAIAKLEKSVLENVNTICRENNLSAQSPYASVAPASRSSYDIFTGRLVQFKAERKKMVLIVGPSNAGKTTLARYLQRKFGYSHIEMSSFAYERYESEEYESSLLDFLEDVLWDRCEDFDILARDMLSSVESLDKVVVSGPRRMEEINTILSDGWEVYPVFIFANSKIRFRRHKEESKSREPLKNTEYLR
ncbi:caspase family protein [Teredinibacter turnerae]|uniref:caspase family protein n=1 Tax=Teredinibacter turnerae TaxID=2426 RepID=UPI00036EAD26|nr:caspase family protein [Teredinibacter turnerae]